MGPGRNGASRRKAEVGRVRSALALLLAGCAASPTRLEVLPSPELPKKPVQVVTYERLEQAAGLAFWDCSTGSPTAWVRIHLWGNDLVTVDADGMLLYSPYFAETVAHELHHLKDAYRLGCDGFAAAFQDPKQVEKLEREAECAALIQVRKVPCE